MNIQNDRGKAKPYQVRKVLAAIDKLEMQRARAAEKKPETKEDKSKKK